MPAENEEFAKTKQKISPPCSENEEATARIQKTPLYALEEDEDFAALLGKTEKLSPESGNSSGVGTPLRIFPPCSKKKQRRSYRQNPEKVRRVLGKRQGFRCLARKNGKAVARVWKLLGCRESRGVFRLARKIKEEDVARTKKKSAVCLEKDTDLAALLGQREKLSPESGKLLGFRKTRKGSPPRSGNYKGCVRKIPQGVS